MSYTQTQVTPAQRIKTLVTVGGIHALIAAGVVAGLAVTVELVEEGEDLTTFDVPPKNDPPPPDDVVDPPETPTTVPPTAAKPPVVLSDPPPITVTQFDPDTIVDNVAREIIPGPLPFVPAPRPTPSPAPSFAPVGAAPTNGPLGWISNNDYPRRDLARGNEGTAAYNLVIGSDGEVNACEITASSGHSGLDRATCRLIERRARFDPATGSSGSAIVGTYSGSVTWDIPE